MKENPSLFGPVPTTGGKVEGALRSVQMERLTPVTGHRLSESVRRDVAPGCPQAQESETS